MSNLVFARPLVAVLMVLSLIGCQSKKQKPAEPPPPSVTYQLPTVESITEYREYTGRTAAIESVEVRARVGGYLDTVEYREGAEVAKDVLLFRIDPRPFQESIRQAEANLAAQTAQLKRFDFDLDRARKLIKTDAISKADLDLAIANSDSGQAQLNSLKSVLARAKLDLEYTEIRSPIAGRTSRALVTPGNLVTADMTILTSVVSMDPIFAYFDVDESSALDYRSRVRNSEVNSARENRIEISLGLANEKGHPHVGVIDFVDNVTDAGTGNLSIRGKFDNGDGALLPGLFARIKVPFTRPHEALLIPQTALAMDQQGRYVLVVGEGNKVVKQVVTVGSTFGKQVAILTGLKADQRVITAGLQKARPGSVVKPTEAKTGQLAQESQPTQPTQPTQPVEDEAAGNIPAANVGEIKPADAVEATTKQSQTSPAPQTSGAKP